MVDLELPCFGECERCKEWYPIEDMVMVSSYGGIPHLTCVHCLIYIVGHLLSKYPTLSTEKPLPSIMLKK